MPHRKTEEEFINEIKIKHPDITIIGHYISSETKLLARHEKCGYEWMARPASLSAGFGCPKCGHTLKKTHEEFVEQMNDINPNISIIGKYVNSRTNVLCQCKLDGIIWNPLPQNLLRGNSCPGCSGRIAVEGQNDIYTLRPDMIEFFANPEDAKKYKVYSKEKALFKCKYCGHIDQRIIANVSHQGYTCKECYDNISYPNKFLRSFLSQCNVDDKQFEYCDSNSRYVYDAYFIKNNKKYLIEMDGIFHYTDNKMSNQTYEESVEIDLKKDQIAVDNGYIIIRIDSRYSNKDYIENNIKNNEILKSIFDLDKIDFDKCDNDAKSNYIYSFCKYYNENIAIKPLIEILKQFGITLNVFSRYYSIGLKFNWCC